MRQKAVSGEAVQVQNPAAVKAQLSQSIYFFLSATAGTGLLPRNNALRQPILPIRLIGEAGNPATAPAKRESSAGRVHLAPYLWSLPHAWQGQSRHRLDSACLGKLCRIGCPTRALSDGILTGDQGTAPGIMVIGAEGDMTSRQKPPFPPSTPGHPVSSRLRGQDVRLIPPMRPSKTCDSIWNPAAIRALDQLQPGAFRAICSTISAAGVP